MCQNATIVVGNRMGIHYTESLRYKDYKMVVENSRKVVEGSTKVIMM